MYGYTNDCCTPEEIIIRKADDKTLTKAIGDENRYKCVWVCGQ